MNRISMMSAMIGAVLACGMAAGNDQEPVSPAWMDEQIEWVTIGDPGNRDTTLEETSRNGFLGTHVGGVDYCFRIMETEVTIGQYILFVEKYFPYYRKNTGNSIGLSDFSGSGIQASSGGGVRIRAGYTAGQPTTMSFEYAARYINWLHNGTVDEEWAYETGVYDTSTFYFDDKGIAQHQLTHHPDARYWIPSLDEWTKAAYWDPKKDYGQGGYWQFPNRSDIEPAPGLLPSEGGERNAGYDSDVWPLEVGSYPHVRSPWGVLDMAGGQAEHIETMTSFGSRACRFHCGSRYSQADYGDIFSTDLLGVAVTNDVRSSWAGLRIASLALSPADLNGDLSVDFFDVSIFIRRYLDGDLSIDFTGDGIVNIDDAHAFLSNL